MVGPEATLARVLPLAARLGITRVANITGLDRVGIPVAAAYRPNSRSLAVFQGKGTTLEAAKASAVMEAAEAWHAERAASLPVARGSHVELAARGMPVVDPARLPRIAGSAGGLRELELDWVEGRDLLTGRVRWVPRDVVAADYTAGRAASPLQSTSHGLAAGNHVLEALCHALCEVIERDALTLWQLLPRKAQDTNMLDLATAPQELRDKVVDRFSAAGVTLRAFDVTSDIGVPAVLCFAAGEDEHDEIGPAVGSGCHPDPAVALARAATEAAQVRLTRIAGARDDLPPDSYDAAQRRARARAAREWLRAAPGLGTGRDCRGLQACGGQTLHADLAAILSRLAMVGADEAVWVDLSDPEIGLPAVRVVVPGLEGVATAPGWSCAPGERASRLLRMLS